MIEKEILRLEKDISKLQSEIKELEKLIPFKKECLLTQIKNKKILEDDLALIHSR